MNCETKILSDPDAVAQTFAEDFARWVNAASGSFHVALSGGSTPKLLFKLWASDAAPAIDWDKVHFYWGDERCVAPDDADSNYGLTSKLFFEPAAISPDHIHRVRGESDPEAEAIRYSDLLQQQLNTKGGQPVFDLVMLGMGGDGHTASIFPHQMSLMQADTVCAVATHPESGQKRITITGNVISAAERIAFLITGDSKAEKYAGIVDNSEESKLWPATTFFSLPTTKAYLDRAVIGNR